MPKYARPPDDGHGADRLSCRRCGGQWEIQGLLHGCPTCSSAGSPHNLELSYPAVDTAPPALREPGPARDTPAILRYRDLLPVDAATAVVIGEGDTPLVRLRRTELALGVGTLRIKLESANPTGSFKDRWNAVSTSVARRLGYKRVAAASTGNQAVSVAAYARAGGLAAVVMCPATVERRTLDLLGYYGAYTLLLEDYDDTAVGLLGEFLDDGYFVASRNWPRPFANPFGLEGYKTIAFEIVAQCGGQAPDAVFVPVAGGDSVFGVWKGFVELHGLGLIPAVPRMFVCQSDTGGASVAEGWERGLATVPVVPSGESLAVSISTGRTGDHALVAVRKSGGGAFRISEQEIVRSLGALAAEGLCLDPSAATTIAGCRQAREQGLVGADTSVVCIGTATGMRWDTTFAAVGSDAVATASDWPAVRAAVEDMIAAPQVHQQAAAHARGGS